VKSLLKLSVVFVALSASVVAGSSIGQAQVMRSDYIVTFKGSPAAGMAAVNASGGKVFHTYSHALNGVAVSLPDNAINGLRNRPEIAAIELDAVVSIDATQSNATWGLDRIDQTSLPLNSTYSYNVNGSYNNGASRVTAYIIDTGILTTHGEFAGRTGAGYSAINDRRGTTDCNGHGTHVAGTVGGTTYGVAKGVRLIPVRVLDCRGSGTNSGVIAGVNWAIANHVSGVPAVANMSLGGGISSALDTAVTNLVNDGVVLAVAAGNSNVDACTSSPARATAAITVGATASNDARASFSNFGTCLDIFAPGVSITSAWSSSKTAIKTISGTSMAAPHVAGVAALILSGNPTQSVQNVVDTLIASSTPDKVTNAVTGSPNRLLFSL
jgi:subtilisin family serine protease